PEPEPEAESEPPPPVAPPTPAAPPPPSESPTPAEAGKVLTAESDDPAPEIADFTMVQGEGDTYAGGVTSKDGRSRKAVKRVGQKNGQKGGTGGPTTARPGPDRSRSARPTARSWNCSQLFPPGAKGVNTALVTVVVQVGTNGRPRGVTVVADPGNGFAAAARACAMGQSYQTALDKSGRPIAGTTAPFSVRFTR
ncbi:MAG: hypothetical protein AAGA56_13150, partial [Myxococcota bacterium]